MPCQSASRHTRQLLVTICGLLISLMVGPLHAAEMFDPARVAVYFSPNGGATEAVVREIAAAQRQSLAQAYSFTSAPIAAQN